jgi:transposase
VTKVNFSTSFVLADTRSVLSSQRTYTSLFIDGSPVDRSELMIRMLVLGYVFAIRSERLICREVKVNLAYRWFCKLGIEDAIPDHSAFSRARNERFREGDVFRRLFESRSWPGWGEGFAIDASLIQVDANNPTQSFRSVAVLTQLFSEGPLASFSAHVWEQAPHLGLMLLTARRISRK